MQIKVALRFHPFSHRPGTCCLLPGSFWQITAFPTLLEFKNLYTGMSFEVHLGIQGPVRELTLEQDLERGELRFFGHSQKGYFRLRISRQEKGMQLLIEKTPEGGLIYQIDGNETRAEEKAARLIPLPLEHPLVPPPETRLSLGVHKAQDWDLVLRRGELAEILPFWMRLADWLPKMREELRSAGSLRLLTDCEVAERQEMISALCKAFLVGFHDLLVPQLKDPLHQGILKEEKIPEGLSPLYFLKRGGEILRSLFLQEENEKILLLPRLPPEFSSGRFTHLRLDNGDLLDLEWSKKLLRRVVIHPNATREVAFALQKPLRTFRVRLSEKDRGRRIHCDEMLRLLEGERVFLDRFEK
ncbi:MAG: hypothetical protein ACHQT8_04140 [Chlamydiales bacterium]